MIQWREGGDLLVFLVSIIAAPEIPLGSLKLSVSWLPRSVLVCAYSLVVFSGGPCPWWRGSLLWFLCTQQNHRPDDAGASAWHGGRLTQLYLPGWSLDRDQDWEGVWGCFIYFSKISKLGQWQLGKAVRWRLISEKCLKCKIVVVAVWIWLCKLWRNKRGSYAGSI